MARPADGRLAGALTRPLVGAIEGVVNLVYIFLGYLLLAGPVLAFARELLPRTAAQLLAGGVTVLVVVLCVSVLVGIGRLSGPVVAAGLGVMVLGAVAMLPSGDWGLPPGAEIVWSFQLVVALAGVIALVAARRPFGQICARFAGTVLFSLVVVARPTATAGELAASRRQLILIVGTVGDLLLLLVADLVIRPPVVAAVGALVGPIAAAIGVGGVLGLIWLVLGIRLKALGGWSGLLLAFLLGAPLLLSLPFLDPRILGSTWPATLAVWGVAIAASLLLVAARRPLQAAGATTFGPALDRGLMGSEPAREEEGGERRVAALGGVVGALLDVALLLAGYWLLAVPIVNALERSTGLNWLGSAVIGALLIGVLAVVWGRLRAAQRTIVETSGAAWARRAVVVRWFAVGLAVLLVGCFAAVPTILAAPTADRFGVAPPVDHVVVNWEFWQPSTPSATEATFNVAVSCSNGASLGVFREAFQPQPGGAMPSGAIGLTNPDLGLTAAECSSWHDTYFRLRRDAGLTTQPSHSWNWVDLRIVLAADGAADVVERHWVSFTSGVHDRLEWSVPGDASGPLDQLAARGSDGPIPINPVGALPDSYVETRIVDGQVLIVWHFPPVSAPGERSFTIQYHLARGAQVTGDRSRFSRHVLVPRTGPVWRTTAAIVFPIGTDLSTLQLNSSDANGRLAALDNQTAWFESRDTPSGGSLTLGAEYPSGAPAAVAPVASPSPTQTAALSPTIVVLVAETPTLTPAVLPTETPTMVPTSTPSDTPTLTALVTGTGSPTNATTTVATTPTRPIVAASLTPTLVSTPTITVTSTVTSVSTITSTTTPLTSCGGDEQMTFSPTNPVVGQQLTIMVSSSHDFPIVSLNGPGAPQGPTKRSNAGLVEWFWRATPTTAGEAGYTFLVATTTPCATNRIIVLPSPTSTATSTWTTTPSPSPTRTPTLAPATFTPTPTSTPCAPFGNGSLSAAQPNLNVNLNWQSTGGCAPYNGIISVQYVGYGSPVPTRTIKISGQGGSTTDIPPPGCWFSINYSLSLKDSGGHVVNAVASVVACIA